MSAQNRALAKASAEVISPAEVSASQANKLLFSPAPGVLTITIPGASGSGTLSLLVTGVNPVTGTFNLATSGVGAAALAQVIEQLSSGNLAGTLSTGLTVSGFINGQAVQIVLIQTSKGKGGPIKASIAFD